VTRQEIRDRYRPPSERTLRRREAAARMEAAIVLGESCAVCGLHGEHECLTGSAWDRPEAGRRPHEALVRRLRG
jgi:hypothetical protein